MASVLQTVFSLPSFQARYLSSTAQDHWATCSEILPADCVDCQLYKIADGLLSGRYSHPRPTTSAPTSDPKSTNLLAHDSPVPVFQEGIKPSMFKALIGKGHEEFSTMRQQDSEEFFTHFLSVLRRHSKKVGVVGDPTEVFKFGMEQRLQCGDCKKVRYRVDPMDVVSVAVAQKEKGKDEDGKMLWEDVQLKESLDALTSIEALEYTCPSCNKQVIATKYVLSQTI